jgi:ATP-dependent phosphofructokinase / diphosphate-dependent phosphofructokinase
VCTGGDPSWQSETGKPVKLRTQSRCQTVSLLLTVLNLPRPPLFPCKLGILKLNSRYAGEKRQIIDFICGEPMSQRIGIVTGGGDCPGLNAVIRAVVKAASKRGWETLGILGGYDGLLQPLSFMPLDYKTMTGLLYRGGTILGTSNRGRFSAKVGHGESRRIAPEILDEARRGCEELGLSALVALGGDGSLSIAQQLYEHGIPMVGVPKTIDNDLSGTGMTFGFDSAVGCATDALDRLHTTAESHNRVMVLEVMGRYAGWIAIYAGIAGGADVILIPEIPFTFESICAKIADREREGKHFTMIVAAEGARPTGGGFVTIGGALQNREARLGGVSTQIADEIEKRTGKESRAMILGHLQRGGSPTHMDRALCTLYGTTAVELAAEGRFGEMVSFTGMHMTSVKLAEATGQLRTVPLEGGFVRTARALGVCLGD